MAIGTVPGPSKSSAAAYASGPSSGVGAFPTRCNSVVPAKRANPSNSNRIRLNCICTATTDSGPGGDICALPPAPRRALPAAHHALPALPALPARPSASAAALMEWAGTSGGRGGSGEQEESLETHRDILEPYSQGVRLYLR
jgi:hypothetical protein